MVLLLEVALEYSSSAVGTLSLSMQTDNRQIASQNSRDSACSALKSWTKIQHILFINRLCLSKTTYLRMVWISAESRT